MNSHPLNPRDLRTLSPNPATDYTDPRIPWLSSSFSRPSIGIGPADAPTKPSQEVNLTASGAACTTGVAFDTQVNADGTSSAFSIPAGQVLGLDHLAWVVNSSAAGDLNGVYVAIDGGVGAWHDVAIVGSGGSVAQNIALPNIPIKAGHSVCVLPAAAGFLNAGFTRIHGFLAKDE